MRTAMKLAVCDDNFTDLHHLKTLLEKHQASHPDVPLHVTYFSHPDDFLKAFVLDPVYDLVILDMVMPFLSGLEVAYEIRRRNRDLKIVFTTVTPDFALDAYQVKAHHYLLKPVMKDALDHILEEIFSQRKEQPILLGDKEGWISLDVSRIAYIEVMRHRLSIHLTDRSVHELNGSLKDLLNTLSAYPFFIRVHKSYVINLHSVIALRKTDLIMKDKRLIPISRSLIKHVRDHYLSHLNEVRICG